ncbi:MAG: cytidylate kinase-like family protein [Prevotella sp.]|jgi:cytidylate kinase|nr:cytidylate kinase-like family protein [Prevotella sp.]
MNLKEKFVIAINRELGSGGRTVGEKLAAKLGVDFYDKALVKALEEKYHLTVEEIENLKGRKNNWWSDFSRVVSVGETMRQQYYSIAVGDEPKLVTTQQIFKVEKEMLLAMAENGSCVITGRSGFFVFRHHPNHINVLIQAPMEKRIQRLMKKQNMSAEEAEKTIRRIDKMRDNYVTKYTGESRYDTRNYDLVINMDSINEDDAAALIMQYIEDSQKQ